MIKEYEGLTTDKLATGPGGNAKIGRYDFGQNGLEKLDVVESSGQCTFDTPNVRTVHLQGKVEVDAAEENTPFQFACYNQTSDEVCLLSSHSCRLLNKSAPFS